MIYLAGPFFNAVQVQRMAAIEEMCAAHKRGYASPRHFLVLKPNASKEDRSKVFQKNVEWMNEANLILACMDDKDTGTQWEMGYGYGHGIPVVGFYENPLAKVNVMLAEGCRGYLRGWTSLDKFLRGSDDALVPGGDYVWRETARWEREVE